jgi:O-antigen/teichoic acid export membrane protein
VSGLRYAAAGTLPVAPLTVTVVLLRLGLSAVAYVVLIAGAAGWGVATGVWALTVWYGLSLFTAAITLTWLAQAIGRVGVAAAAGVATQGLGLALLWAAVRGGAGLWAVPAAAVVAEAVVAAAVLGWAWKAVGRPTRPFPLARSVELVKESAPIGWSRILRVLCLGADPILLGLFVTLAEVGWYSGAYKFYMVGMSVAGVYSIVLIPRLSRAHAVGRLAPELAAAVRVAAPLSVLAAAVSVPFAGPVLGGLFGDDFRQATLSLQLLGFAWAAAFIGGQYRCALIARGDQRIDLMLVAAASVAHLVTKLVAIPLLGMTGAAVGTLVSEIILLALTWAAVRRIGGRT